MTQNDFEFDFQARAAMMQDNVKTVGDFLQSLIANNQAAQVIFERARDGDPFAFSKMITDFERREEQFRQLAEVIRNFSHEPV